MVIDKLSCSTVLVVCIICCSKELVATPRSWMELDEPSTAEAKLVVVGGEGIIVALITDEIV